MTSDYIKERFKACIDQFYHYDKAYVEKVQLDYIGGILQAALFVLSTKDYYELKQYIYEKHGYDAGGVVTGQYELKDYRWESEVSK